MQLLKQSIAINIPLGPFLDSGDGNTERTDLTINQADVLLSKNGGAMASKNEVSVSAHDRNGNYICALDTTDTNTLGRLRVYCHVAGALAVLQDFLVVPPNVWDSLVGGTANLAVDTTLIEGADATDQIADAVWDERLTGATHNIQASAGRRLRQLGAMSVASGTAEAGASNSVTLEDGEVSTTDHIYNENLIAITGGTGAGQVRMIVEYTGATRIAIVDRVWRINPDTDSEYQIMSFSGILLSQHGRVVAATASAITLSATALSVDNSYVGSVMFISTGIGEGQARLITQYIGNTKSATVSPDWDTIPDSTSIYKILPVGRAIVESFGADALVALESKATDALNAYAPPTKTEMDAAFALLHDITVADILAGVVDGSFTIQTTLRAILANSRGRITKNGNEYAYKRADNVTTDFTHTLSNTERSVS
jgi:hypothetical protein